MQPNYIFKTIKSSELTLTNANEGYLLPPYPIPDRQLLIINNPSSYTIYIGGSDVSTSNGLPLKAGDYLIISISNNVYAVCGTAAQSIRLFECA